MATQRFVGSTVREVLQQVRVAFGDDAVIHEQSVQAGDVIVLASAPDAALITVAAPDAAADVPGMPPAMPPAMGLSADYSNVLLELGFAPAFVQSLRVDMPTLRHVIAALVHAVGARERKPEPLAGVVQVIGGPGSGKTTALVKLLCDWLQTSGRPMQVLLIAEQDQSLAGAHALQLAGDLLGVEVRSVERSRLGRGCAWQRSLPERLRTASGPD